MAHEILAGVEAHDHCNLEHTLPVLADRFCEVSEAVFVLLGWNETYEQLLDNAAATGCRTTVLMIDGSDRAHVQPSTANRPDNIRYICPDEILRGQVRRL
jgi:hypothetical protein